MAEPNLQINNDTSRNIVIGASQGAFHGQVGQAGRDLIQKQISKTVVVDQEVSNLLEWLAAEQGLTPEVALKKAVATAAYIHDVTANQGGKLLVKHTDNSVGEIVLK
jgi:hypothetical protein